jgi:FMN-dependent NADH-azoreductase
MSAILYITASPRGEQSWSRRIGDAWVDRLATRYRDARFIRRDLAADPPPGIGAAFADAILKRADERSAAERDALGYSEQVIGELEAADHVVIATPMNNYTVPATLKTWIDHVVRARRTFMSTPSGKVGLLPDRPTWLITSSGGHHTGEAARQPDFLTPYLRAVLATIGIHDLRVHSLEGLTRGPDAVAKARAEADAALETWAATLCDNRGPAAP